MAGIIVVFILRRTLFPKSSISLLIIEDDYLFVFDKFSGKLLEKDIYQNMLSLDGNILSITEKELKINLDYFSIKNRASITKYVEGLEAKNLKD